MDLAQSLTGLVLGLFMWGHMFFVSSILISKDAMWTITKLFEGYFFFGTAFPGTTRIGKYVINHSFILPGLIGVISSCIAGYLIAGARGIV
jgi:fumarate reductase subunit C